MIESNNRRRALRAKEHGGIALCHSTGSRATYRVRDVSSTGIGLDYGPDLEIGTPVNVHLSWTGVGQAYASGVVCRSEEGKVDREHQLGLRLFQHEGVTHLLRDLIMIQRLRKVAPHILVCGRSGLAVATADELEERGVDVLRASFPLDVICAVQDPWKLVTRIVFAAEDGWTALADVVEQELPDSRRVLVVGAEPDEQRFDPRDSQLVHECVRGPWTSEELLQAIQLEKPDFNVSNEEANMATAIKTAIDSEAPALAKEGIQPAIAGNAAFGQGRCLSCGHRVGKATAPFCAACLDRSRNLSELDDLGCGD